MVPTLGGQLAQRQALGLGIDEAIRWETDLDGDGSVETIHLPLYDSTGNLAQVTDATGKPVERYAYSPFGERQAFVDGTAPEVEQVRIVGGEIWVELSEAVAEAPLAAAVNAGTLLLEQTATGASLSLTATQPITTGRQARRRIVLTPDPVPAVGEELRLVLPQAALVDSFLNQPATASEQTFDWPAGDAVLIDTVAPTVQHALMRHGKLELLFSEPLDLASASSAIQLNGAATTWDLSGEGYGLTTANTLTAGSHTLAINTSPLDLAGQGLAETFTATVDATTISAQGFVYQAPDPRLVPATTTRNPHGFQGLPLDPETGFLYVRNRYYDPEIGRFISADPLGYVDVSCSPPSLVHR